MYTVRLSAFGDEAAADLMDQMDVLENNGIHHIELRGVWGKNVLSLNDDEVNRVRKEMDDRGFKVSSIGSPIGKVGINDDWDKHLKNYERIVEIAKALNTRYIRLFSFFIPKGEEPSTYRAQVMEHMKVFADIAGRAGLIAVHENERDIYGDTGVRCADILKTVDSPNLRAVFDSANYVQCGVRPLTDAYPLVKDYIEYIHIKDAVWGSGKVVPAGEGDGDVKEILRLVLENGFNNFLTVEPHLSFAGKFAGFSGPELFTHAVNALKGILDELGVKYE